MKKCNDYSDQYRPKTPPASTSRCKTPPAAPSSRTKTPPAPSSGSKTPTTPTCRSKAPPAPTSRSKTPPAPTSRSKTPQSCNCTEVTDKNKPVGSVKTNTKKKSPAPMHKDSVLSESKWVDANKKNSDYVDIEIGLTVDEKDDCCCCEDDRSLNVSQAVIKSKNKANRQKHTDSACRCDSDLTEAQISFLANIRKQENLIQKWKNDINAAENFLETCIADCLCLSPSSSESVEVASNKCKGSKSSPVSSAKAKVKRQKPSQERPNTGDKQDCSCSVPAMYSEGEISAMLADLIESEGSAINSSKGHSPKSCTEEEDEGELSDCQCQPDGKESGEVTKPPSQGAVKRHSRPAMYGEEAKKHVQDLAHITDDSGNIADTEGSDSSKRSMANHTAGEEAGKSNRESDNSTAHKDSNKNEVGGNVAEQDKKEPIVSEQDKNEPKVSDQDKKESKVSEGNNPETDRKSVSMNSQKDGVSGKPVSVTFGEEAARNQGSASAVVSNKAEGTQDKTENKSGCGCLVPDTDGTPSCQCDTPGCPDRNKSKQVSNKAEGTQDKTENKSGCGCLIPGADGTPSCQCDTPGCPERNKSKHGDSLLQPSLEEPKPDENLESTRIEAKSCTCQNCPKQVHSCISKSKKVMCSISTIEQILCILEKKVRNIENESKSELLETEKTKNCEKSGNTTKVKSVKKDVKKDCKPKCDKLDVLLKKPPKRPVKLKTKTKDDSSKSKSCGCPTTNQTTKKVEAISKQPQKLVLKISAHFEDESGNSSTPSFHATGTLELINDNCKTAEQTHDKDHEKIMKNCKLFS